MQGMQSMNVSIVIPNYNGEKYIIDCIASIYDQIGNKRNIIVIDNHSADTSVSLIKGKFPNITLIENDRNFGFAAAVNQGIRASDTKYVILLNNDAFARKGFVRALVECMERDPVIFSAGAKMLRYSEPGTIDDAGDEFTILGWAYKSGDGRPSDEYNKQRRVFSACAGAAIYRRQVFEEIGLFDEYFFAYLEDVDIGFRANLHGYKNVFCPTAEVEHIGSATSGSKYNDFKLRLSARNNVWLIKKNFPLPMLIIHAMFFLLGFIIKIFYFAMKGHGRTYVRGLLEGLRTNIANSEFKYKQKASFHSYLRIEIKLISGTWSYLKSRLKLKLFT